MGCTTKPLGNGCYLNECVDAKGGITFSVDCGIPSFDNAHAEEHALDAVSHKLPPLIYNIEKRTVETLPMSESAKRYLDNPQLLADQYLNSCVRYPVGYQDNENCQSIWFLTPNPVVAALVPKKDIFYTAVCL